MSASIFADLPNDLIMRIIRETKSSLDFKYEHSCKGKGVLLQIEYIGEIYDVNHEKEGEEYEHIPSKDFCHVVANQFFATLHLTSHNTWGGLTSRIIEYRQNGDAYLTYPHMDDY